MPRIARVRALQKGEGMGTEAVEMGIAAAETATVAAAMEIAAAEQAAAQQAHKGLGRPGSHGVTLSLRFIGPRTTSASCCRAVPLQ